MSRRTTIIDRDVAPARSAPTDTGVAFVAGITAKGAFDSTRPVVSMDDFETRYGTRQSYSVIWDWMELFFREGGNRAFVAPVRGPAVASASLNLAGTSGTTLVVTAKSAGDWANGATGGLSAEVANGPSGATHRVIIIRLNGVEVERTSEFSDRSEAVTWSAGSEYVNITLGGGTASLPTVAASANLTGGTLDRTNITQTQVTAALALFSRDLGPGQEASPDWQTEAAQEALLDSAAAHDRFAFPDTADVTSKSSLLTAAALVQGHANGRFGALVGPWVVIAGTAGGAERYVPASAFVCAKIAETDPAQGANQRPSGVSFGLARSSLVTGVRATFSDSDQEDLQEAGVNLVVTTYEGVYFDGEVTLVEPLGNDREWIDLGNARLDMDLHHGLRQIGIQWEHRLITPSNIAGFDTALNGYMLGKQPMLYPAEDESDPGFVVDTTTVNTPTTAGNGELLAAIGYRPARGAGLVTIYLTKVGVADALT